MGNLIFYVVGGKQYVRSKPAKVRQPNTHAQLQARDRFRQSSKLAKSLSKAVPFLVKSHSGILQKSAYHTFLGILRKSRFIEDSQPARWIWPELTLREGNVPEINLTCAFEEANKMLLIKWNCNSLKQSDTLIILEISTDTLDAKVYRFEPMSCESSILVKEKAAFYAFILSDDEEFISGSQFIYMNSFE
ncbi:MAG: hypothetical protein JJ966_13345 [Balneolaceae bacterium]|nr:hypothetical protein [Balneolaceae bacterium]